MTSSPAENSPTMTSTERERDDRALCAASLPLVSRTFAISIEGLPEELREPVRIGYLLCRIVDTVEDGPGLSLAERLELFDSFDALVSRDDAAPAAFEALCVRSLGEGIVEAERRLCCRAGAVLRRFRALGAGCREAIRPHVLEMSRGMREYVARAADERRIGLGSMADLERYCYFVAGTVGQLLTTLFLEQVPVDLETRRALEERAIPFGLGLQMVNILKDAAGDFSRGICYMPRGAADQLGLSLEALLDPEQRESALTLVRSVCGRAREHLDRAREYTELWPVPRGVPVRLFCAVPLALAFATLEEVECGADTLRPERAPRVSRESVGRILRRAERVVSSNQGLDELFAAGRSA
jgi:farnesyl-diphosphate farnesyltransferase